MAVLEAGRFRRGGEIHLTMYDRVLLKRALTAAGFAGGGSRDGGDEPGAGVEAEFCLDTEADGSVYKPDSLFMEAVKPA